MGCLMVNRRKSKDNTSRWDPKTVSGTLPSSQLSRLRNQTASAMLGAMQEW